MNYLYIIILASMISAVAKYIDKYLVNLGITKKDYFYYMCVSMVPFSIIMCIIEYFTGNLKFSLNVIAVLLLLLAMFFRYIKQNRVVPCLEHLNPYEDESYLSLVILFAYIIDIIIGVENFKINILISIILILFGILLLSNAKLKIGNLKKNLSIRIITTLIISYITYFLLQYWSTAVTILFVNLFLTIIFFKDYSFNYHKKNIKIIKFVFIQQSFGFFYTYLLYYLTFKSVTLSSYVGPITLVLTMLISLLFKDSKKRATLKQILAIMILALGIFLIY